VSGEAILQRAEYSGNLWVVGAPLGSSQRSHRLPSWWGGASWPLPKNSIPILSLRSWGKNYSITAKFHFYRTQITTLFILTREHMTKQLMHWNCVNAWNNQIISNKTTIWNISQSIYRVAL